MVNIEIGEIRLGISDLGNVKVGNNILGIIYWEKRIGKTKDFLMHRVPIHCMSIRYLSLWSIVYSYNDYNLVRG